MDIQHISALIEMLHSLGFPASTSRTLLLNACLRQKNFTIEERIRFGEDTMSYQLHFKEDIALKSLTCSYYDATLRKAVEIATSVINGVDVSNLEKRMAAVKWQMPIELKSSDDFKIADKTTWKQEAAIEEITKDLELLGSTAEGAHLENILKYKFWTDMNLSSMISELPSLKGKYELNQKFYIINEDGITAIEAYRFLNNRWMERNIHANNRLLRQSETAQIEARTVKGASGKKRNNISKTRSGK